MELGSTSVGSVLGLDGFVSVLEVETTSGGSGSVSVELGSNSGVSGLGFDGSVSTEPGSTSDVSEPVSVEEGSTSFSI